MRTLRLRIATLPVIGYAFRWAVIADGAPVDLALSRRAALRRRPVARDYSTVLRISEWA